MTFLSFLECYYLKRRTKLHHIIFIEPRLTFTSRGSHFPIRFVDAALLHSQEDRVYYYLTISMQAPSTQGTHQTTHTSSESVGGGWKSFSFLFQWGFWLAEETHHPGATCRLLSVPKAHTSARPLCRKTSLLSEGNQGNAALRANAEWKGCCLLARSAHWMCREEAEHRHALYCAIYGVRWRLYGGRLVPGERMR